MDGMNLYRSRELFSANHARQARLDPDGKLLKAVLLKIEFAAEDSNNVEVFFDTLPLQERREHPEYVENLENRLRGLGYSVTLLATRRILGPGQSDVELTGFKISW
jgi:hypothetical protein